MDDTPALPLRQRISELARLFFTLGVVGFGGPAAHIAMMEEEVVRKRKWMTPQGFLDLVGATNLIPGPNSTEMTMHVGFARAGWLGLFVAGASFIVPAAGLTLGLAWLYVQSAEVPDVAPWLAGIPAAVLAVIAGALWRLGKKAIPSVSLALVAAFVVGLLLLGVREIPALLIGAAVGGLVLYGVRQQKTPTGMPSVGVPLVVLAAQGAAAAAPSLGTLGLFFLKVGSVLYGSGYVLVAYLEADVVGRFGWLTQTQLLDAIALGQLTPGPVLTTSTAVGYLVQGLPGALVATVAIFLPSFVFTGLLHPLVPKLRSHPLTAALLDAVNAASVALMAVVTVRLALGAIDTPGAILIAVVAAALVFWRGVNVVALVVGAAIAGGLLHLVGVAV
ncbi:chromate efflux transporter [Rubrivirga sp. IMCC43871]|uniref:chromate efflux transporter n=1 Tax=Rubrivirga sp. IMCC43871 TaxID=3391575 RepID=UPI00398FE141